MVRPRITVLLSVVVIISLLAHTAVKKQPMPTGASEDYWEFACGVELSSFDGLFYYAHWKGVFPDADGWYFYYYQLHHGRRVYKVKRDALIKHVPEVYSLLGKEIAGTVIEDVRENELEDKNGRRKDCLLMMNKAGDDYPAFIDKVSKLRSSASNLREGEDEINSFKIQLARAQRYWASIIFEAFYLCFWWIFTFHGGVLGKWNRRISVRAALSPMLFFLPFYLGYASYLFTYGPSGGVLYPFFAAIVSLPFYWIPCNPLDAMFLRLLRQPLDYISQVPASPLALSYWGCISPTVLIYFAILVWSVKRIWQYYRNKIKRSNATGQ